ncbi:hypothetical protein BGZ76_010287 [Entomortierella beljakovae]|nr:hypothetical protein BGZ76_010287 [Entomortierella beljakovae]
MSSQLPPGWVSQYDSQYKRNFYVNESTGASQWEPPSGSSRFDPPSSPPSGARRGESNSYQPKSMSVGSPPSQSAPRGYSQNSTSSDRGYPGEQKNSSSMGYPPPGNSMSSGRGYPGEQRNSGGMGYPPNGTPMSPGGYPGEQKSTNSMGQPPTTMSSGKGYYPEEHKHSSNKKKLGLAAGALLLGGVAIHEHNKHEKKRDERQDNRYDRRDDRRDNRCVDAVERVATNAGDDAVVFFAVESDLDFTVEGSADEEVVVDFDVEDGEDDVEVDLSSVSSTFLAKFVIEEGEPILDLASEVVDLVEVEEEEEEEEEEERGIDLVEG